MRMWNVDPRKMCRKHILGEHVEMHMFVGSIRKGISLDGFVANNLVETGNIRKRHDALALEMVRRGMNHNSPLASFKVRKMGTVDPRASMAELVRRCKDCERLARSNA